MMDIPEMIQIAKKAVEKNMNFSQLEYSDYMYGYEAFTDIVWNYVEECKEIGTKAFYKKYPA